MYDVEWMISDFDKSYIRHIYILNRQIDSF